MIALHALGNWPQGVGLQRIPNHRDSGSVAAKPLYDLMVDSRLRLYRFDLEARTRRTWAAVAWLGSHKAPPGWNTARVEAGFLKLS